MKVNNNLPELISATLSELEDSGYSSATINNFKWAYNSLRKFCIKNNINQYDEYVGEQYLDTFRSRQPQISVKAIQNRCRYIQRLNCALDNIDWIRAWRPPIEYASSCYNDVTNAYEAYLCKSGKTVKDVRRRVHIVSRFLKFTEQRGCLKLSDLSTMDVYSAFQDATDKGAFRRLVGAFLNYAYKYKLINSALHLIVPSVVRHTVVPSVYSTEEIERLLESVDRTTDKGKRDYAIILIAARLGLRASDIAGMTFDCICEITSTIRIVQAKTKNPLTLPLLYEVKSALFEYINDARPASSDNHIFLNLDGFGVITPSNIGQIVKGALARSSIDCDRRRRGSHSLRASLATALLDEGIDYTTIQQVLGQSDIQSTKSYVKADIEMLRVNALKVPPPVGNFKILISGGGEL